MAAKIAAWQTGFAHSGETDGSEAANLVQGVCAGVNSSGALTTADRTAAGGKIACRGFVLQAAQQKDPKGNVLQTNPRTSLVTQGKVGGMTVFGGALTPGATYYLSSGGAITSAKPGTSGDLAQMVGWALDADTLVIQIGEPHVI